MGPHLQQSGIWINNLDDLVYGLVICICACLVSGLCRRIVNSRRLRFGVALRSILLEGIESFENTAVGFELSYLVFDHYGLFLFILGTFLYCLYATSGADPDPPMTNPVVVIAQYLQQRIRFERGIICILTQLIGAFASYFLFIRLFWKYGQWFCFWKEQNVHTMRYNNPTWATMIDKEMPIFAALVEGSMCMIIYLQSKFISRENWGAQAEWIATQGVNAVVGGMGAPYSGGYYNPALASALEYFTVGVDFYTKLWVYWLFPFLGICVALLIDPFLFAPPA